MPTEETTAAPEPDLPAEEVAAAAADRPEATPAETPPADSTPPPPPESDPGPTTGNQNRTLAEIFTRLPLGARIAIVVLGAVVLTLVLLWTFLRPLSENKETEQATETAVAAFLTLTAQPTATSIGTETPRIYIIEESPTPSLTPDVTSTPIVYVVQPGDTLNSIARRYNATVQDIATANGLTNVNSISVGQELIIPTPGAGTVVPTVTVGPGTPTAAAATPDNRGPITPLPELVIMGVSGAQTVDLRIAAGPDYQAITTLSRGTIAALVAKTPDGLWYLIQLEDGYTRGWIPANSAGLIYPADPAAIPTTPQP